MTVRISDQNKNIVKDEVIKHFKNKAAALESIIVVISDIKVIDAYVFEAVESGSILELVTPCRQLLGCCCWYIHSRCSHVTQLLIECQDNLPQNIGDFGW